MKNLNHNNRNEIVWEEIRGYIHNAAKETVGGKEKNKKNIRGHDPEIEKLSEEQKNLRIQIENSRNLNEVIQKKAKRNKIMREIKEKLSENKEKEIEEKLTEINNMKDDSKMFKAVKLLNQKKYQNPFVHDENGRNVTQPTKIYHIVKNHFQNHFNDPLENKLDSFTGTKRKLNQPITLEEVQKCSKKLKNNRAPGYDEIPGELIKYGPDLLHEEIKTILNNIFEKHETIPTNHSILLPLPKPKKPKGPTKNLRPINLLPSIRKILSLIILERIQSKIESYVSKSQAAYKQYRSTSDCIFAYRWIIAKLQIYKETIYITGIDMSAAFDTIRRKKIIEIVKTFLDEDEVRMLQYLLAETSFEIRMENVNVEKQESNIGTPQGDALSGNLFTIYFEYALRKLRAKLEVNKSSNSITSIKQIKISIPEEIIYADDADFLTDDLNHKEMINEIVKKTLLEDNLKVNEEKTEHTTLVRIRRNINKDDDYEPWRNVVKLGSKLGDCEDIQYRKQLATNAIHKMNNMWIKGNKVKVETRIKMYNSLIKPVLLYNSSTWGITENGKKNLNSFHRKQLRQVLNVRYPDKLKDRDVYDKTGGKQITLEILAGRWRLLGHVLRLNVEIPAHMAILNYLKKSNKQKFQGRPRVTLPLTLNEDITKTANINEDFAIKYDIRSFKSLEDYKKLRLLAGDREKWKSLSKLIYETAEAEVRNS